jgi:putative transposase
LGIAKGTRPFIFAVSAKLTAISRRRERPTLPAVPRANRTVFPGIPHHVTQRGNHRERVFHAPGDPEAYLALLNTYARQHGLRIFAYCLMPNHIHLVVTPGTAESLHLALRTVHSQYAQRVNRMRSITGHLWQGRYGSCALDPRHFLNAVRYVELNPVKAGLCRKAEDYPWSSARAHCADRFDPVLESAQRSPVLAAVADWSTWLAHGVPEDCRQRFRNHERGNLPCGSPEFVDSLERTAGRPLQFKQRGGQLKSNRKK